MIACAPGEDPDVASSLREMGITYRPVSMERTGMNPARDIRSCLDLAAVLRGLQPDVVFSYTIKPVIYGSLAARLAKVPEVYSMITGLGYAFIGQEFKQKLVNRIVRTLYRVALSHNRRVFFQNSDDLEVFVSLKLIPETGRAVVVNGSGVDLDYYADAPLSDAPVFLLVARLLRDKGIVEYAEAARRLKLRHPKAVFQILGPYDSNPAAISRPQMEAWERDGVLEYLGETDDVRPFLRRCTVYVLPSYREGTPRSVLEAMAMGRPVVTTDAPGCRETVRDGENGFLVPVKDVEMLAQAMERFLVQPELIRSMGKRSREIAEEKYDVRKVNAVILRAMGLGRDGGECAEKGF